MKSFNSAIYRDKIEGTNSETSVIPSRNEVTTADCWDLSHIFLDDTKWENEFNHLKTNYNSILSFQGLLSQSVRHLAQTLEFETSLQRTCERLAQYAVLRLSEDSSNSVALERHSRFESLVAKINEVCSWIAPEIQEISNELFEEFITDPILADWQVSLKSLRRLKPHTLSHKEERLLALASPALSGHEETFSQLTNVDIDFGFIVDENEKRVPLTQSTYSSMVQKKDRAIRQIAFHQFYEGINSHRYTLSSSLVNSVKSDIFFARARNYSSAIEAALFPDNIPLSVYDNLIATVRSKLPILHRYYALRKSVFQLSEIHVYDTYAPLIPSLDCKTSFNAAVDTVLKALKPLGKEYIGILESGIKEQRWCDRYENKGKRSGAFSYGIYDAPPYILMNYKEDVFSDIYTLAHEAGHSMHTWYSRNKQNFQNYRYPIFLAEVASTFNEILLTESLIKNTDDPLFKAYVLNRQIDDIRSTLFRQTMFAEFEKKIHEIEEEGEGLVLEKLTYIYRSLLNDYFGSEFFIDEILELEALRIPHFYSAFYVYKYATGISAAIALAKPVLETGHTDQYFEFLSSGSSLFPLETLAKAGVAMHTPEPILLALELFEKNLIELEHLLQKI